MMTVTVERIANLACLLEEPLQEKLWEYAELLYVEQVAFDDVDSGRTTYDDNAAYAPCSAPPDTLVSAMLGERVSSDGVSP